ncbi:MAG: DUF885 domain-containing protein [Chloroflexi bacterium]|nr:DUF885 domain-containing protein [Chloroflexota bacterium]MDA1270418.1 DUF885 domain-containing protein [Chloroflexota bacterium]PKB58926.1 MAG: hypothetical protein BZY83_04500 [SAR202 cluster bacterium Casp-Chloro-G2]
MAQNETQANLQRLSERLIKDHWDFYPTAGSRIGRHEYDGRLPDLSPAQNARRSAELRQGLKDLGKLDPNALDAPDRMSYRMLELFLRREQFIFNDLKPLENNPMRHSGYLNVSGYIRRDYAPLEDRLRSAASVLQQAPDFLEVLDRALSARLSSHVVDMSVESYSGMARFYRVDLAQASKDVKDPEVVKEFDQARETAAAALDRFAERLKSRGTHGPGGFAIGPELYSGMLATGEGLDAPLSRIAAIGQANLEDNLSRIKEVAQSISPGRRVGEIVEDIGRNHPQAQRLIPETREMLEDIRQSLIDFDVISVPSEDRCQVIETPAYMRYAFAAMDSAGALETKATESFYYVTPVEDDWTVQQSEEWLSNFNYDTLKTISIHEVYPGHFVHHLHNRYGRELPLVNRVATAYSFTEGWAHYTEEMMLETGYGAGQPRLLLTQLLEALVRNCRYMCSLGMHTGEMTLEDATRFFMENAYMAELPARREALRGTFDPGYLNYTLGKLMILKLREDYQREQGSAYSLKTFHDRLLSFGGPALPLLRPVLLNDPGTGAL